jgi:hypothetical protein
MKTQTSLTDFQQDYFLLNKSRSVLLNDGSDGKAVRARVFVTQAYSKNGNKRAYRYESLSKSVEKNNERVSTGQVFGYTNHPPPLYDDKGNFRGYDYKKYPAAYRIDTTFFEGYELWSDVTFTNNEAGKKYAEKFKNQEDIYVSSRGALSQEYVQYSDYKLYDVMEFEAFDIVLEPAVDGSNGGKVAKFWSPLTDAQIEETKKPVKKEPEESESDSDNSNSQKPKSNNSFNGNNNSDKSTDPSMANNPQGSNNDKSTKILSQGNDNPDGMMNNSGVDVNSMTPDDILAIVYSWPSNWQQLFINMIVTWMQGAGDLSSDESGKTITPKSAANPGNANQNGQESQDPNESNENPFDQSSENPEMENQGMNQEGNEEKPDQKNGMAKPKKKVMYDSRRGLTPILAFEALKGKLTKVDTERIVVELTDQLKSQKKSEILSMADKKEEKKEEEKKDPAIPEAKDNPLLSAALNLLQDGKNIQNLNAILGNFSRSQTLEKTSGFVDLLISTNNKLPADFKPEDYDLSKQDILLLDGIDLSTLEEDYISKLSAKAKSYPNPSSAVKFFTDTVQLASVKKAEKKLEKKGFNFEDQKKEAEKKDPAFKGKTTLPDTDQVDVNEGRPYMAYFDKMEQAQDDWRRSNAPATLEVKEQYKKTNKVFADMMWEHRNKTEGSLLLDNFEYQTKEAPSVRPLTDSQIKQLLDSSNPLGSSQLRNQPMIVAELERQVFWQLMSLQFMRGIGPNSLDSQTPGSAKFGRVFRFSSLSYGAPDDGNEDFFVGPDDSIPEISMFVRQQEFFTRFRALAIRMIRETIITMASGPLNFNVIGEGIAQMSAALARQIDNNGWLEMQMAIDEHQRIRHDDADGALPSEDVEAVEWYWRTAGVLTVDGITYGNNVYAVARLRCGETTNDLGLPIPVLRPRRIMGLALDGSDTVATDNDIDMATLGGIVQIRGKLNATKNIVDRDDDNPGATFAVNFPKAHLVFLTTADSGADSAVRPTDVVYSHATNYVRYNLTPDNGIKPETHYNGLLYLATQTKARIWSERYVALNTLLGRGSVMGATVPIATEFYKLNSRTDANLAAGFAEQDTLGQFAKIMFMQTNGNLPDMDNRAMFFANKMSCYGVGEGVTMNGPIQAMKAPNGGGRVRLIPQWKYQLEMMDCFGTPLTIGEDDENGDPVVYNFPGISVIFDGDVAYTTS